MYNEDLHLMTLRQLIERIQSSNKFCRSYVMADLIEIITILLNRMCDSLGICCNPNFMEMTNALKVNGTITNVTANDIVFLYIRQTDNRDAEIINISDLNCDSLSTLLEKAADVLTITTSTILKRRHTMKKWFAESLYVVDSQSGIRYFAREVFDIEGGEYSRVLSPEDRKQIIEDLGGPSVCIYMLQRAFEAQGKPYSAKHVFRNLLEQGFKK